MMSGATYVLFLFQFSGYFNINLLAASGSDQSGRLQGTFIIVFQ